MCSLVFDFNSLLGRSVQKIRGSKTTIVHLRGDSPSSENDDPGAHAEHLIDFG
jgi:hypothetical protein